MKNLTSYKLFEENDEHKRQVILEVIDELQHVSEFPVSPEILKKLSIKLRNIGMRPTDIDGAIYDVKKQKQYLIDGPSAPGGGGQGALKDLQRILQQSKTT